MRFKVSEIPRPSRKSSKIDPCVESAEQRGAYVRTRTVLPVLLYVRLHGTSTTTVRAYVRTNSTVHRRTELKI